MRRKSAISFFFLIFLGISLAFPAYPVPNPIENVTQNGEQEKEDTLEVSDSGIPNPLAPLQQLLPGSGGQTTTTTTANPLGNPLQAIQQILGGGGQPVAPANPIAILGSFQAMIFPMPKLTDMLGSLQQLGNLLNIPRG